jgi:formamidopyrimidine-DNA glycosylase
LPELPEVETIRRQLEPVLAGRTVVDAGSLDSPKFAPARRIVGRRFERVGRRGKYLLVPLDDGNELVVHLGMTGGLRRLARPTDEIYVRAWWALDDGSVLELRDVRRFGRLHLVPIGGHESIPTLRHLGPEPLSDEFTPRSLLAALGKSRRALKTQILSQRPVAGVGNLYADEALWRARVHPATRRVGIERATRLHAALRAVLVDGLRNGGTTLRDYRDADGAPGRNQHHLDCYGRAGHPCARCGAPLRRAVIDQRGTTWCPACQRA